MYGIVVRSWARRRCQFPDFAHAVWICGRAARWYFGSRDSYPYFLALLGYAVFGAGAALLAVAFLGQPGLWRWVGIALLASGIASVTGFAGYASGCRVLESGSVIGGALCLPLAVLVRAGAAQL